MTIHTANFTASWNLGAGYVAITPYVISIDASFATQNQGSGLGFGDSSDATFSLKIDPNATGTPLSLATLALIPVRCQFTIDANAAYGCAGVVLDWAQDADTIELRCTGFKELISKTRAYSPLFTNRPVATKTTASSIEDPTNGAYAAGPLNWLLWQAGGRPLAQAGTYPSATFYYQLSQAPIAPAYAWIAGEDSWAEAIRLVRACGGQLWQKPDGTIEYRSPLSIAGGSSLFALTLDDYADISRKGSASDLVASFTTTYVPRILVGMTEVVSDSEARVVAAGATITIELEPQYPISTLETAGMAGIYLLPEAISATFYDGVPVTQSASIGYTHTLTIKAQQITIVITNAGSQPFVIERITLRGTPIVPGEAGTITIGSGNPTQTIEQSAYIQSRSHAQRLERMALAFYGVPRPVITARGVLYDPTNHQIGNAGTLTQADWGLSAAPIVILGVTIGDTGISADLDVVETTGLPKLADYFLVQPASQASLTRRIGY